MNTKYTEIVNPSYIGKTENPIFMNEILLKAMNENLRPSKKNPSNNLLIAIDVQQDFIEGGALAVPGSIGDVERLTRWMYDNMDEISQVTASIDTHNPFQIFHPCWWIDKDGNNPNPFTLITLKDLDDNKWIPVIRPKESREYVAALEKMAKKTLCIWPYHCLQGTTGGALENQFSNMLYFFSVSKKVQVQKLVKGTDPLSEMYGILKPEYSITNQVNIDYLDKLEGYDKIIIAGEAKSHCVLESIRQILEYYVSKPEVTGRVYILEDCMSVIPGFEQVTEDTFKEFKQKYNVNIVQSKVFKL